jgi:hypothetical protein
MNPPDKYCFKNPKFAADSKSKIFSLGKLFALFKKPTEPDNVYSDIVSAYGYKSEGSIFGPHTVVIIDTIGWDYIKNFYTEKEYAAEYQKFRDLGWIEEKA